MRLSIRAMVLSVGIVWGVVVLLTGLANSIWSGYGAGFLELLASVYPGYKASGSIGDVIIGALYALVEGAIGGLVFAWLYNRFVGNPTVAASDAKQKPNNISYSPVEPHA